MWWKIGLVSNAVVAIAYLLITVAVLRPLMSGHQMRANRLGTATAAIFFTCAIHHGGHVVHMLLPDGHIEVRQGLAMRASYDWEMACWDVVTAAVGVYYWTLRRMYSALVRGAKLFDDLRQREHDALELNDNVLQGLVVAKLAFELDQRERAMAALDSSISAASRMITDFLGHPTHDNSVLLRSQAATVNETS
jgi:hypothetical protein